MTDLTKTIEAKSDQLNADDLIGKPITIKVTNVSLLAGDQPVALNYEGDNGKPYKPCKSMRRVLVMVWGSDGNKYIGRSLTLYRDEEVTWAGLKVGGIRISHMSGIESPVTLALTATRNNKKPYTVNPLKSAPVVKSAVDLEAIKSKAAEACLKGSDVMQDYWNSLSKEERLALKPFMDGYKEQAEMADEINNPIIGV